MENTVITSYEKAKAVNNERQSMLEDNLRYARSMSQSLDEIEKEFESLKAKCQLLVESNEEKDRIIHQQDATITEQVEMIQAKDQLLLQDAQPSDPSSDFILASYRGAKIELELLLYAIANLETPLLLRRKDGKRMPARILMEKMSRVLNINLSSFQSEISHALLTKTPEEHCRIFQHLTDVIFARYGRELE